MNLKLLKLNSIIIWQQLRGKIKKISYPVEYPVEKGSFHSILVCFPTDEKHFRTAWKCFRVLLDNETAQGRFSLLVSQNNAVYLPNVSGNVIPFELERIDEVELWGAYDMVLNLNPVFNLNIAGFLSRIPAKYKVGFDHDFADMFYNLQFRMDQNETPSDGFQFMFQLIMDS